MMSSGALRASHRPAAPDGASVHYEHHRPEPTTLYRLLRQHASTFIAEAEDAAGTDLPELVKDEFLMGVGRRVRGAIGKGKWRLKTLPSEAVLFRGT